jgi:hypothetical protein
MCVVSAWSSRNSAARNAPTSVDGYTKNQLIDVLPAYSLAVARVKESEHTMRYRDRSKNRFMIRKVERSLELLRTTSRADLLHLAEV